MVNRTNYWGVIAVHLGDYAGFLVTKREPKVIMFGGQTFRSEDLVYIGDCSPIVSVDAYAVGVQFGFLNIEPDHLLLQSILVQRSENIHLTTRDGVSHEMVIGWSKKAAKLPDANGNIMASIALRASDREWAIAVPFDMFKNDVWCDEDLYLGEA